MLEELLGDDGADRVAADVLGAGAAAAVAVEPGHRVGAAGLERLPQDVAVAHRRAQYPRLVDSHHPRHAPTACIGALALAIALPAPRPAVRLRAAARQRRLRLPDRRRLSAARRRLGRLPRLVLGRAAADPAYSICYVNAFQTQANERGTDRPDERSNWPRKLVLNKLGDDPNWGGEYLVDISTGSKRKRAARWVGQMIDGCAEGGFEAVEFDNLDSWTRFDGTPLAKRVPFGKREALAYAKLLGDALARARPGRRPEEHGRRQPRAGPQGRASTSRSPRSARRYDECGALPRRPRRRGDRRRVPARRLRGGMPRGRRRDLRRPARPQRQPAGLTSIRLRGLLTRAPAGRA